MTLHEQLSALNWQLITHCYNTEIVPSYLPLPVDIQVLTSDVLELVYECIENDLPELKLGCWRVINSESQLCVEFIATQSSDLEETFETIINKRKEIALSNQNFELVDLIENNHKVITN